MFRDAVGVRHATTPKSMVLGQDSFKGMGVAFADLTDTGVPDIVVSNITEPYALQESDFVFLPSADRATVGRGLRDGVALYDDHIVFGLFFAFVRHVCAAWDVALRPRYPCPARAGLGAQPACGGRRACGGNGVTTVGRCLKKL